LEYTKEFYQYQNNIEFVSSEGNSVEEAKYQQEKKAIFLQT
jgi:hypothetical protein